MSHIFSVDVRLVIALLATQLVFSLYGAGLRRPFGSLATITELPISWRKSTGLTLVADVAFLAFLLVMWGLILMRMDIITFFVLAVGFAVIGDFLSKRISLVPSFYLSLALAACSVSLVLQ